MKKRVAPKSEGVLALRAGMAVAVLLQVLFAGVVLAQPTWNTSFSPSTIGPGSTATLTYSIFNGSGAGVRGLAFSNTLPAAVTIASPSGVVSTCQGSVSAPAGGSTVSLSGGALPGTSCTIAVNVTSSTPGAHLNTTGDLTSAAGNSGTASATLTVATDRPGFSKSFSPSTVPFGGRSTLTFTLDNSANAAQVFSPSFIDNLPVGMTLASPVNVVSDCPSANINATPGASVFSYTPTPGLPPILAAGASCSISVDVLGGNVSTLVNVSQSLTVQNPILTEAGKATAALLVTAERLSLTKSFIDDPASAGDEVTLEFTVINLDRRNAATDISFTDDLDATLSGLIATSLPGSPCGAGSALTGSSVLTLTGGNLPAEGSCTFSATLQIPAAAADGTYTNTTSTVTGNAGLQPISGSAASDVLVVSTAPTLSKTFLSDPVGGGDVLGMEITITNSSATQAVTDIAFTDNLSAFIPGVSMSALPATGFCGGGSLAFTSLNQGLLVLNISGGNLAAGASCTFQVDLQLPLGLAGGTYVNTTSDLTATQNGATVFGGAATAQVTVPSAPALLKQFIDDPVLAGGTATLRFTIFLSEESQVGVSDIAFTDDLGSALAGLTAVGTPLVDVCGAGSQLTGTTNLSFTGGSLPAAGSCSFDVTVQVPAGALPGSYTNTTSNLMAASGGVDLVSIPAVDDLQVAGLSFSKTFVGDPVIPGAPVSLEFTITNSSTAAVSGMFFTDNLGGVIPGLSTSSLPTDPCGTGSLLIGPSFLIFQGGSLDPGTSCTFSVGMTVPTTAASGTYVNTTSNLTGTIGGTVVLVDPASDGLEVSSQLLGLSKSFVGDPVAPGDNVPLEFTVTNLGDVTVTDIAFSDDLGAILGGLASTSGTSTGVCGAASSISGTDLLTFTGGELTAGASCTFSVNLLVPSSAAVGSEANNTTSTITGLVGGVTVEGGPALDTLELDSLTLQKAFDSESAVAGSTVQLTFTLDNPNTTQAVPSLRFSDDLEAFIPGAVAVGLPVADVCGEGSLLEGTSLVTLTGASLMAGGNCSFSVTVQIPSETLPGDYTNVTSEVVDNAQRLGAPAADTLTVEETQCVFVDDFDDGVVDPSWTLVGIGNANQQSIVETSGRMELTADGATAFYGADNAGFLYQEIAGDFRMEVTIDGNPMTTGGLYEKAGLMVRASLDKWDIRLIAQLAPFWEERDETHLQFVARQSFGTPGRLPVARDVIGVPRVVRLAIIRSGQRLSVEYSIDGGVTWIQPTTGLGGSIDIAELPETLLVGLDMVSNNISVTSTAYFDDFELCRPE